MRYVFKKALKKALHKERLKQETRTFTHKSGKSYQKKVWVRVDQDKPKEERPAGEPETDLPKAAAYKEWLGQVDQHLQGLTGKSLGSVKATLERGDPQHRVPTSEIIDAGGLKTGKAGDPKAMALRLAHAMKAAGKHEGPLPDMPAASKKAKAGKAAKPKGEGVAEKPKGKGKLAAGGVQAEHLLAMKQGEKQKHGVVEIEAQESAMRTEKRGAPFVVRSPSGTQHFFPADMGDSEKEGIPALREKAAAAAARYADKLNAWHGDKAGKTKAAAEASKPAAEKAAPAAEKPVPKGEEKPAGGKKRKLKAQTFEHKEFSDMTTYEHAQATHAMRAAPVGSVSKHGPVTVTKRSATDYHAEGPLGDEHFEDAGNAMNAAAEHAEAHRQDAEKARAKPAGEKPIADLEHGKRHKIGDSEVVPHEDSVSVHTPGHAQRMFRASDFGGDREKAAQAADAYLKKMRGAKAADDEWEQEKHRKDSAEHSKKADTEAQGYLAMKHGRTYVAAPGVAVERNENDFVVSHPKSRTARVFSAEEYGGRTQAALAAKDHAQKIAGKTSDKAVEKPEPEAPKKGKYSVQHEGPIHGSLEKADYEGIEKKYDAAEPGTTFDHGPVVVHKHSSGDYEVEDLHGYSEKRHATTPEEAVNHASDMGETAYQHFEAANEKVAAEAKAKAATGKPAAAAVAEAPTGSKPLVEHRQEDLHKTAQRLHSLEPGDTAKVGQVEVKRVPHEQPGRRVYEVQAPGQKPHTVDLGHTEVAPAAPEGKKPAGGGGGKPAASGKPAAGGKAKKSHPIMKHLTNLVKMVERGVMRGAKRLTHRASAWFGRQ